MSVCSKQHGQCSQDLMHFYLEAALNDEAKSVLESLENLSELTDTTGRTLLHYSVEYEDAEIMQYLINKGCEVDARDNFGESPLMLAVKAEDLKSVKVLLKNKADIYMTNCFGKSILQEACTNFFKVYNVGEQYSSIILKNFIDNVNRDFSEGKLSHQWLLNSDNLVKLAVVGLGNSEITKFLLENGYPIDYHEPNEINTALHYAILWSRFENAKMLIEHGANVDVTSPICNYTAGKFEDVDENSEVLKSLLSRSTRLAIIHEFELTPVELLLIQGKKETVKTVLSSGIDIATCLSDGATLLFRLVENRNDGVLDVLDELNIKFDANEVDELGYSVLQKAVIAGPKPVEFLLQHGAVASFAILNGQTALTRLLNLRSIIRLMPCKYYTKEEIDKAEIAELLLQYGADDIDDLLDGFEDSIDLRVREFTPLVCVIIAHAAMLEVLYRKPSLTASTRNKIELNRFGKSYVESCFRQLEEMKRTELYGAITLFKLLTDTVEEVAVYARNQQLILAFTAAMKSMSHLKIYYVNTMQRNLSMGSDLAKLQDRVALVIESLTGLCATAYHPIIYGILNYLSQQDLVNISKLKQ